LFSLPAPDLSAVKPSSFAGRWAFYDDGWLGTLTLHSEAGQELSGTCYSERFGQEYRVTGSVSGSLPHKVEIVIHDYNWLDRQVYEGYLLTHGRNAITGRTTWRGEPFGFVARRTTTLTLGSFGSGPVRPADFAGGWTLYLDGQRATLELTHDPAADLLRGQCTGQAVGSLQVTGQAGTDVGHGTRLVLHPEGEPAAEELVLSGYLFSRPKNAIAGWIEGGPVPVGFYLVKFR
jgi:hypothetical protein